MANIKTTWDFVEKYYPNYSSSDEIAENDDLTKIIDGELNGNAEKMYNEAIAEKNTHYDGMISDEEVENEVFQEFQNRLHESNACIYGKAIEGYIESLKIKQVEKTFYLIGGDATREYNENGIEGVVKESEANELTISSFCFIEGETRSSGLAEALDGWDDYVIITEEEFNLIN